MTLARELVVAPDGAVFLATLAITLLNFCVGFVPAGVHGVLQADVVENRIGSSPGRRPDIAFEPFDPDSIVSLVAPVEVALGALYIGTGNVAVVAGIVLVVAETEHDIILLKMLKHCS